MPNLLVQIQLFRSGKDINSRFIIQHGAIYFTQQLQSPCEKRFRQRCVSNLIKTFFIFKPFAVHNSLVFGDNFLENVTNQDVCQYNPSELQSIWLLMYTPTLKKHAKVVTWVRRATGVSSAICSSAETSSFFLVFFISTTFEKVYFRTQKCPPQKKVIVPILLKNESYALSIEWCSKMKTSPSLSGRQPKNSRNCRKKVRIENWLSWSTINVCWDVSTTNDWRDFLFIITYTQLFLGSAFSQSCSYFSKYPHLTTFQLLMQQNRASQHLHVLQLGRFFAAKLEMLFSQ